LFYFLLIVAGELDILAYFFFSGSAFGSWAWVAFAPGFAADVLPFASGIDDLFSG